MYNEAATMNLGPANEKVSRVYIEIQNEKRHIMTWNTGEAKENTNIKGHTIRFVVPETLDGEFKVILESDIGESVYRFISKHKNAEEYKKGLNA